MVMRGKLRLKGPDGDIERAARVVRHGRGDAVAYSWHGDLHKFDHLPGLLILDDGREVPVVVDGGFLRTAAPY
jgi:hypothetical protein